MNAFVSHLSQNNNLNHKNNIKLDINKISKNSVGINELKSIKISHFKNPMEFYNQSELSTVNENNESKNTTSNELDNKYLSLIHI